MKIDYVNKQKENWFLVSWNLSNKCNYACSYCPATLHNGSTGHKDWKIVKNFVENFTYGNKDICYRISGGEPTTWKHFIDLAKLIKQQGQNFSFLSNGSRSVDYFKDIAQYTDGLILSYHPEYTDVDHFVKIINVMNCPVAVNLMLVPEQFDELVEVAHKLFNSTNNCMIWPKVILNKENIDSPSNEMINYTQDQKDFIKKWPYFRDLDDSKLHRGKITFNNNEVDANYLIVNNLNRHKGWTCWAGIDMIHIDKWGNLYRADCAYGSRLGNLQEYTLPNEPIICGLEICSCLSDIYLRKEKI